MKPFGREKKIRRNIPDHHPHPKHLIKMWWEDMCDFLSRSSMKQKLQREIKKEIEDDMKKLIFILICCGWLCGCQQTPDSIVISTAEWRVVKLNDTTYLAVPVGSDIKDVQVIKIK